MSSLTRPISEESIESVSLLRPFTHLQEISKKYTNKAARLVERTSRQQDFPVFLLSNQDQVQVQSRDKYHEDRSSYLTTSLAKNAIYYLDLGCRLRDINSIGGEVSLNCVTSSKFLLNPRTTP